MTMTPPPVDRPRLEPFAGIRQAQAKPAPGSGYVEYPHAELPSFRLRVHASGRRQWVLRMRLEELQPDGSYRTKDLRKAFADVPKDDRSPGPGALSFADAMAYVLAERKKLEMAKAQGTGKQRWTLGDAWKRRIGGISQLRAATRVKDEKDWRNYLSKFEDELLDTLDVTRVERFAAQMLDGSFKQGMKPLAPDTVRGPLTLLGTLYNLAHENDAAGDRPKDWNPAEIVKKKLPTKVQRRGAVPLSRLRDVWLAADTVCTSWARDQLRLYVLTGLRHGLMAEVRFDEIDFAEGVILIPPARPGTKRRARDIKAGATPLKLPLSRMALSIFRSRQEAAKNKSGPVWYLTGGLGGRGNNTASKHSDPRSNWKNLAAWCDVPQFLRHDLRRTFATIGVAKVKDLMGISLLMLHSSDTLAQAVGIPGVTVDYMQTEEAQDRMRVCAEGVATTIKDLLAGAAQLDDNYPLPAELAELFDDADE